MAMWSSTKVFWMDGQREYLSWKAVPKMPCRSPSRLSPPLTLTVKRQRPWSRYLFGRVERSWRRVPAYSTGEMRLAFALIVLLAVSSGRTSKHVPLLLALSLNAGKEVSLGM